MIAVAAAPFLALWLGTVPQAWLAAFEQGRVCHLTARDRLRLADPARVPSANF